jgi:hypothetical protein
MMTFAVTPMGKNIVICCDNTGNQVERNLSNVLKLFRILQKNEGQRVYYNPGIGTIGTDDPWTRLTQNTKGVFESSKMKKRDRGSHHPKLPPQAFVSGTRPGNAQILRRRLTNSFLLKDRCSLSDQISFILASSRRAFILVMRDRDRANKNEIEILLFSVTSNDFPHDMLLLTFSSNLGSKLWCRRYLYQNHQCLGALCTATSLKKGVLTVRLPKKPEAQKPTKKIEVKAA